MKFHSPCNSFTPRQVVTPAEEKRLRGGEGQEVASSREHCGSLVMFWRGKATQIHGNQVIDWEQRTRERKGRAGQQEQAASSGITNSNPAFAS